MWFRKKELDIRYVVIEPFDRVTMDAIQDDLVDQLKDLLQTGYKIISASGSLNGSIHYVLVK